MGTSPPQRWGLSTSVDNVPPSSSWGPRSPKRFTLLTPVSNPIRVVDILFEDASDKGLVRFPTTGFSTSTPDVESEGLETGFVCDVKTEEEKTSLTLQDSPNISDIEVNNHSDS